MTRKFSRDDAMASLKEWQAMSKTVKEKLSKDLEEIGGMKVRALGVSVLAMDQAFVQTLKAGEVASIFAPTALQKTNHGLVSKQDEDFSDVLLLLTKATLAELLEGSEDYEERFSKSFNLIANAVNTMRDKVSTMADEMITMLEGVRR